MTTLALLNYIGTTFAALPPYYQSTKELMAILSDPEVEKKLASPYPIKSIIKTDSGYMIAIQDCELEVKIIYLPQERGFVGPAKYKIEPQEKVCHKRLEDSD